MLKNGRLKNLFWGLAFCAFIFTGCGSSSSYTSDNATAQESMEIATEDVAMTEEMKEVDVSLESPLNRKIIKTGELFLETKTFEITTTKVLEKVSELEGFIENSTMEGNSLYSDGSQKSAQFIVRLPNEVFEKFINNASEFGNVRRSVIAGEDITDLYVDTSARLVSLQTQRERLLSLLENSGSLTELLEIEKELANVSYEVEQLQGSLNKYDSLIDYATLTIYIEEVRDYTLTQESLTLSEKLAQRFNRSVKSVKRFGEEILLAFVGFIPVVVMIVLPLGIISVGIAFVIKKIKQKKKQK